MHHKIIMENKRKAGRPKLPVGIKRPRFVTHISPETFALISAKSVEKNVPLGHIIDMMAKAWCPLAFKGYKPEDVFP